MFLLCVIFIDLYFGIVSRLVMLSIALGCFRCSVTHLLETSRSGNCFKMQSLLQIDIFCGSGMVGACYALMYIIMGLDSLIII